MKKIIILLWMSISIIFAQSSANDIFFEVKGEKKEIDLYPNLLLTTGVSYNFYQGNDLFQTSFDNNLGFSLDINKYFFQGMYLNLSTSFAKTTYRYKLVRSSDNEVLDFSKNVNITNIYLGINYLSQAKNNLLNSWVLTFGLGADITSEVPNSPLTANKFSALIRFGKITDISVMGAYLTFDLSMMLREELGFRIYEGYYSYYQVPSYVLITTVKLSSSLTFDISNIF